MKKLSKLEAILWNIALPGFSQLLAGRYLKGITLILLEFAINVNSHFNIAIMYSFLWEIDMATKVIDFQWLMFYPCVYMFGMWDAYRDAMPKDEKLTFLPFVFGAYFVTIGLMYSTSLTIFGIKFGPVFLPMLFLLPGLIIGLVIKYLIIIITTKRTREKMYE
ncbi:MULTISPECIES: hypothetical protein [unclassified Bacillus (in: firmicutes)]|uniref:hypothetical protein n=1 Tax=unclassified Bacillus (in: firmicutes) TaxID=185979 RepID=UPI0008E70055|nr:MULTISPECIES: hypothetical protein [unclassified Bacillus (in: firmicutes)]SFA77535.1 hypothetical protein SAMN02799634_101678 [Bacillus sp. UNCCL13]SFQ67456.1 hypothetical protein SAMN04488577_0953 [Bacillus sp. cl95]